MRWTFVDSCGLDVVPKPPANGRVSHIFNKLQSGSYGLTQPSRSQPAHHPHSPVSRSERLKTLFFPARRHLLAGAIWLRAFFKPAVAENAAVSITSEDQ
jgi:hypothetical protein